MFIFEIMYRKEVTKMIEEIKKEKEIRIKEVALSLFIEKGFEKTSIRDIMRKTDYGLGTFYLYFKNKEDLVEDIVLDRMTDLIAKAEAQCQGDRLFDRYISFLDYIINYLVVNPAELDLIISRVNWALYVKVENNDRFKVTESTLKFILNKYESMLPDEYSEDEQLFVLSLTMNIVLSTCKSALMENAVLDIDEMKAVLYEMVERIFRTGE